MSRSGKYRIAAADIAAPGNTIAIRWYARVERTLRINSVAIAEALAPLHILSIEVVRERFGYKGDGLNVAFVRVFEVSPVWVLQMKSDSAVAARGLIYRSRPEMKMRPVLDDSAHTNFVRGLSESFRHPERSCSAAVAAAEGKIPPLRTRGSYNISSQPRTILPASAPCVQRRD